MSADEVYALMRDEGREMYLGRSGGWFLTYGGGPIADQVAADVIARPNISHCYKHNGRLHSDCYRFGPTIDLDETIKRRRERTLTGRGEVVFVDGTTGYPR